jgi:hypothetical protein
MPNESTLHKGTVFVLSTATDSWGVLIMAILSSLHQFVSDLLIA